MPSAKSKAARRRRTSTARSASARPRSTSGRRSTPTWGVAELRQFRSLEDENARLKRLVADLSLDKHILTEALRKNV